MKRIKKIFLILSCVLIMSPILVFAQPDLGVGPESETDLVGKAGDAAGYEDATDTSLAEIVGMVVKTAMSLLGIIFTVLMVYGGFLWMTARGEEAQVTKAKDLIRSSIIGLIIAVAAYSITSFVLDAILVSTIK